MKNQRIYLDHNGTYPASEAHLNEVFALLKRVDGNPSSTHFAGRAAKAALEDARALVAGLLGAKREEVMFTSGATEANNMVLRHFAQSGRCPHVVISATEHASVLTTATYFAKKGWIDLSVVPVHSSGVVDDAALLKALRADTALVSIIDVNNETGAQNPIETLAIQVKAVAPQALFHSDVVQSFGKVDRTWIAKSAVDFVALSAHKIGGLKGVGALYKKASITFEPSLLGGQQEWGGRGGTQNLVGILSLGLRAKAIAANPLWLEAVAVPLRNQLLHGLQDLGAHIHGDPTNTLFTTVNFHLPGFGVEELLINFDTRGVAVSAGSACASGNHSPSHVLVAMGYPNEVAQNSVRVSLGVGNLVEEIATVLKILKEIKASRTSSTRFRA